ncbi:hypothetical protein D0501_05990 [Leuconostoc holzapfelii]|uniref:Uncharacterized protein n=1 Tax=Leuconostoc holzapfelii TaxID=434464 RepID=A0ABT2NW72_9LACO|nr:hypothetical protein [Leuconostoc holzapfelii]MCT8389621.1 hypothetical protein [Leuconostoc holzapfelii]
MDKFQIADYSAALKKDLTLFDRWQVLVAALNTTTDATELLDILQKILAFDMHQAQMVRIANDFWFPSTHWVTVAFAKLSEAASLQPTTMMLPHGQKVAELHFEEWPNATFRFTKAPLAAGGYYLEETAQNLRVLYWDFNRQRLYLDTQQFAKLVQTEAIQLAGVDALTAFQKRLVAVADQLMAVGFDIEMPGLDAEKQAGLVMVQKDLPAHVLDSLFVTAAKQQFVLKRMQGDTSGAEISLGDIAMKLTQHRQEDGHSQWTYDIIDHNQIITIYTLLQQLPFFYQWYAAQLTFVGLKDKREVFVD